MLHPSPLARATQRLMLVAFVFLLGACSSLKFPGVYKVTIFQGNIIDGEKLDQVEVGMTKRQVQYLLGTPLAVDTFNQDRWDYYYSRRKGENKPIEKRFTAFFEGETLVRYEGTVLPREKSKVAEEEAETLAKEQEKLAENAKKAASKAFKDVPGDPGSNLVTDGAAESEVVEASTSEAPQQNEPKTNTRIKRIKK